MNGLSDIIKRINAEMQRKNIVSVSEESNDHYMIFRLNWSVAIEIKVEWKGKGTLSYHSNETVVGVRSSPVRARKRTRVFRKAGGIWPVERIISTVLAFQNDNLRLAEDDGKLRLQRERLLALSRRELPHIPSGMHLMRLSNGHYRISITELTLPLEGTKRLIHIVEENNDK